MMSYNLNLIISILLTNYNRRCHYLKYYGKLIIGETNCTFELKDYTLTIFSESDVFLGWKNLNSILDDNNWLYLNYNDNHYLYLKIDGIDYLWKWSSPHDGYISFVSLILAFLHSEILDMKADKKVRPPAFTSKDVENKRSCDLFLIQLLMKTLPEITLYMNCRFLCPLIPVP